VAFSNVIETSGGTAPDLFLLLSRERPNFQWILAAEVEMRILYAVAIATLALGSAGANAGCPNTSGDMAAAQHAQRQAKQDMQQARRDRAEASGEAAVGNFGSSAVESAEAKAARSRAQEERNAAQFERGKAAADAENCR
jgi:hypothetical protein